MKLGDILNINYIYIKEKYKTKEELITNTINLISEQDTSFNKSKDEILKSIFSRENDIPTATGRGISIPHAKVASYKDVLLSVVTLEKPIRCLTADLKTYDNVSVFFIIVANELKTTLLLKFLSSISRMCIKEDEWIKKILAQPSPEKLFNFLKDIEIPVEKKIVAEEIMDCDTVGIFPETTLKEVVSLFIIGNYSAIPVIDSNGFFLGEITDRELISYGMPDFASSVKNLNFFTYWEPFKKFYQNEETQTIESLYKRKKKLIVIQRDTPLLEICRLLIHESNSHLYVVEGNLYLGVIYRKDILKNVLHI